MYNNQMTYELKYKKYKNKYLKLKNIQHGGGFATLYIKTKDYEYTLDVDSDIFSQIQELKEDDSFKLEFSSFNLHNKSLNEDLPIDKLLEKLNLKGMIVRFEIIIKKARLSTDQYIVTIENHNNTPSGIKVDDDDLKLVEVLYMVIDNDLKSIQFKFDININTNINTNTDALKAFTHVIDIKKYKNHDKDYVGDTQYMLLLNEDDFNKLNGIVNPSRTRSMNIEVSNGKLIEIIEIWKEPDYSREAYPYTKSFRIVRNPESKILQNFLQVGVSNPYGFELS